MKKRKPCNGTQTRSPSANSPRAAPRSAGSGTVSQRSKSFQDLKRRHLQQHKQRGSSAKQQRRVKSDRASVVSEAKKRDVFGSLESLFDVKKLLKLPDLRSLTQRTTPEPAEEYSSDSYDLGNLKSATARSYGSSSRVEHEPDIVYSPRADEATRHRRDVSKLEELEFDRAEDNFQEDWKKSGSSLISDRFYSDMAEEEDAVETYEGDEAEEAEEAPEPSAPPEETNEEEPQPEVSLSIDQIPEEPERSYDHAVGDGGDANQELVKPPEYPIPPGVGEGVPLKPGAHRESNISWTPLTDSRVIEEMRETEERCNIVRQEMNEIKLQIAEMKDKKDVTEEDAKLLKEKQTSLMTKMQEFDEMTRKIQRVLGLADPSSQTFAKMFEMLPYPHTRPATAEESAPEVKDEEKVEREEEVKPKVVEKDDFEEDSFDLPQPEYPEDKLPRAIVCGFTEDKMPKIVIPDSRPKGDRCLKNLTGKLSESLNMQEKLVQENAKLEGGKYKLEEALLEKDNTLDSLQRKVCGLQAEMRIVVKENTELSRQLASRNNQRSPRSQFCCSTCPGDISPRSIRLQQSSCSYASSSRRDNESCRCASCLQEQYGDPGALRPHSVCVNPDGLDPYQKSCVDSPRLSGGGSREGDGYFVNPSDQSPAMCCRGPASMKVSNPPSRTGACPAEMGDQLASYGPNTNQLAQQLDSMENEVRNMQMELANVHRERQQLEQQRKLLKCTGPCAPCSCCPPAVPQAAPSSHQPPMVPCVTGGASVPPPTQHPQMTEAPSLHSKMAQQQAPNACSGVCTTAPMGASSCPQQQLRDLREQYARLQEDYRNKVCEVSCLRADVDKMRQETREAKEDREKAEIRLVDLQARLKTLESEKQRLHGSKEQFVEQEQALLVAKQRYREAQDELEELRSLIQDQANQLEDYRNKYLLAQEQVEEQRRQLDLMEMDNARMNENVTLEIGRVKNQFQEKLAELAPLPDILKQTQSKLQEVQQMRLIAERNCEDLSRELLTNKDKLSAMQGQLSSLRAENAALLDQNGSGSGRCEQLEKKNSELRNENERMKNAIARTEEQVAVLQQRLDEKMHEVVQLTAMLEQVREDSARQVARTKERCETVRRTMQGQIAEMEKQLAQCRATARAAQKDRDEIRQKMQGQINNLNEAFDQAQGRIRSLQGHVNYLKTSYSNIFNPGGQAETPAGFMTSETGGHGQGYDSCDCNY